MEPKTASQEAADKYREWIKRLCPRRDCDISLWPGLANLAKFTTGRHNSTKRPRITIVNIPKESSPTSKFSIMPPEIFMPPVLGMPPKGPWNLVEKLPSLADTTPSSQLIIVENICPDTLAILGGTYDIDPQFFAEHVNDVPWYNQDGKASERLPSLPSTKKGEDFLILRYVETRELELSDDASVGASSFLWPDHDETRIGHAAEYWSVSSRGQISPRMAFTKQTVSIWCQKKTSGDGWIAIMLLDPPFQPARRHGHVGKAEYRNPNLRPKAKDEFHGNENMQTFREAFCHLLEQRCSADRTYCITCATDIFLVLYEGYRIIASEWLVVIEYIKKELVSIEHNLEISESTFLELEQHLKELYRIRRRCNKDRELVTEAVTQCRKRGQALWPSSKAAPHGNADSTAFVERHALELEEDLQYVLENINNSISRIEKNITLVMAHVTVSEGRQGLQENRGIAFLTLIATIFLPCETVATVLGIQTQYGPGASSFWMLWAVALPLTVLVITIPFFYPIASAASSHLWAKYHQASPKATGKPGSVLQDEGVDLFNLSP